MLKRWLFLISLGVGGAFLLRQFFYEPVSVASGSMEPTLFVGGHYFMNKWIYRVRPPKRGEIIVFKSPVDGETGLIKRVIGIPGDQIELKHKQVFVNGSRLEEPYAVYKRAQTELVGDSLGPLTVPDDTVFVLGDNRDESFDSTTWKHAQTGERIYFLPKANIKGKLMQVS